MNKKRKYISISCIKYLLFLGNELHENEPIIEETSEDETLPPPPSTEKPIITNVSSSAGTTSQASQVSSRGTLATPAVRKIAKENDVN